MDARFPIVSAVWLCAALLLGGCPGGSTQPAREGAVQQQPPVVVNVEGFGELIVAGPITCENLSVFVLCRREAGEAGPDYLTLEEGIRKKLVELTETKQGDVQRLVITNHSDRPLFLHAGEIVKGGRQDRTLQASVVIPPKAEKVGIPSFCVESGRWAGGRRFIAADDMGRITASAMLNSANIRSRSQSGLWAGVQRMKVNFGRVIWAESERTSVTTRTATQPTTRPATFPTSLPATRTSKTTSLNEELDAPEFTAAKKQYTDALGDVLKGHGHPIGLGYAVNGEIGIVNIYHTEGLLRKVLGKLLDSYVTDAATQRPRTKTRPAATVTAKQIAEFITKSWDGKRHEEKPAMDNLFVRRVSERAVVAQLSYRKRPIHVQVIRAGNPGSTTTRSAGYGRIGIIWRGEVGISEDDIYIVPSTQPATRPATRPASRPADDLDDTILMPVRD